MAASRNRKVFQHIDRAGNNYLRFTTTEHTGFARRMACMPKMGLLASLRYTLLNIVLSLLCIPIIVGATALFYLALYWAIVWIFSGP